MEEAADLYHLNVEVQNVLRREQEQFPLIAEPLPFAATSIAHAIQWSEALVAKSRRLFPTTEDLESHEEGDGSGAGGGDHDGAAKGHRYSAVREVRRDGNCFIRSVLFRSLELQLNRPDLAAISQTVIDGLAPTLCAQFSDYVQDFCDIYRDVLEKMRTGKVRTAQDLIAEVCNPDQSEYLVCCFRYIVSNYIRAHEDMFLPFIEGYATVNDYCNSEVEAVSRECEQIHVTALCNALSMPIVVQYLDLSAGNQAAQYVVEPIPLNEGEVLPQRALPDKAAVHLLYRPGHFDVLYPV
jgi:ubiquitin thioesterase protein OTUB1